jgi:hypothetical protein
MQFLKIETTTHDYVTMVHTLNYNNIINFYKYTNLLIIYVY